MNPLARIKSCIRYSRRCSHGSLWNFIHGFSEATVRLNGITRENYKAFISDREYWEKSPYNGVYTSIIDNKLYLPYLLKDYPEHVPQYYYFLNHGIFRLGCGDGKPMVDFGEFLARLRTNSRMVLKHIGSSCGKGFYLLEYNDGCILNGERMTDADMQVFLNSLTDYVASEYVQQHEYARNINASSLNTIRLLCVRDMKDNSFHVARCFHRFGSNGSIVDNLGSGNACLQFVNIETGELEADGMVNNDNKGEVYSDHVIHASGKDLAGMKIPGFHEVMSKVIEISNGLSFLKYVGWDVAITDDGFKIIEANSLTSLGVLQRKGGFLEDPLLKQLFTK